MGHVSNFPAVNRDPAAVPDFSDASEFPTEDDIGRLLGSGLDDDFSFLGDALVNDCYSSADVLVPTNITSLIHADDEAHDKNFSLFFDPHDTLSPILQSDSYDIPCPVTNSSNSDASNGNCSSDQAFTEDDKQKSAGSSPEYFNEQNSPSTSSTSPSEQSSTTAESDFAPERKNKRGRKRKFRKEKSASVYHSKKTSYTESDTDVPSRPIKSQSKHNTTKKKTQHKNKEKTAISQVNEKSKALPRLVIKLTSQDEGIYKAESLPVRSEVFAPTIADKVKMGRRGQNGGFNDEDFRKFLENSEAMMKKPRRRKNRDIKDLCQDTCESKTSSPSQESSYTSRSDASPEYTSQVSSDVSLPKIDNSSDVVVKQENDSVYSHEFDHISPEVPLVQEEYMSPDFEFDEAVSLDDPIENAATSETDSNRIIKTESPSPPSFSMPIITNTYSLDNNHNTDYALHDSPKPSEITNTVASASLSMPAISDLLNFGGCRASISTPEPEVELGELPDVPIPVLQEEHTPPQVPSSLSVEPIRKRKSKVPTSESKNGKLTRPVVPFKILCAAEPKSEPPQRYSLPDTPLCSPVHLSHPGTSGGYSSRKRRESNSSSSSSSSGSSSESSGSSYDQRHRSPTSKKIKCEKMKLFCQRCQRYRFEKKVKYNAVTDTLTDEFGRELRPSEREEYKMSCHCGPKSYSKPEKNYSRSRPRSRDLRRKRIHKSVSRSRSRSPSKKYVRNGSRERSQRSPSSWRERDRPIEERRVLYVGDIPYGMSEASLRERFINFGPIEDVQIKFKYTNHVQKIFGFITFKHREDAYNAKENGNKDPLLPKFDLNFGGRRKFCNGNYTDLDGNVAAKFEDRRYYSYSATTKKSQQKDLEFEELLQMEKQRLKAKGLSVNSVRPRHH